MTNIAHDEGLPRTTYLYVIMRYPEKLTDFMEEANEYICKNWAGKVQKYFSLVLLVVARI